MLKCGIIGYRGMVGQVLLERMSQCEDFTHFHTSFFGDGEAGSNAPTINGKYESIVISAQDIDALCNQDVLISLKGGEYSHEIYPKLLKNGFSGFWIDASSAFRMDEDAMVVLDPLNKDQIKSAFEKGVKKFAGGNCTVSLLLLALQGLIEKEEIEWVHSMSYQAASGAGAEGINGLIRETKKLVENFDVANSALENEEKLTHLIQDGQDFQFGAPLAFSLIPFIDAPMDDGSTKEEWKAGSESARILKDKAFPIEGLCVRTPSLRAHAQALTIKTKNPLKAEEVEELLAKGNEWVKVIPNEVESTRKYLSPVAVSGKLNVHIGRIKNMAHDPHMISAFTVGDQLLWGAAEPLRRVLLLVNEFNR